MLRRTVFEALSLRNHQEGKFGVEIEVEGKRLPLGELNPKYWRVDRDGSLKAAEAFEYVTPIPMSLIDIKKALDHLDKAYIDKKSVVDESIRAGIHVHLNVQDYYPEELWTFITAYYVLEDLLTEWCGPSREGNHFCLRSRDSEFSLFAIAEAIKGKNLKGLNTDNLRYAALNPCSLFKYGSLEFRAMRGTRDLNAVYQWVKLIDDLEKGAKQFKTPEEVIYAMSAGGSRGFVEQVLGESAKLFARVNDIDNTLRDSMRRTQIIAFAVDWNTYKPQQLHEQCLLPNFPRRCSRACLLQHNPK